MKILFFFKGNCSICISEEPAIKDFADEHGIEFQKFDVDTEEGFSEYLFYSDKGVVLPMIVFISDSGEKRIFKDILQLERFLGGGCNE
jgi:thiol-disulfide isomerase/thioredoxin